MTYDGQRAMFEAYARNKYTSTGVIQWMLNNSWPSLIWHLYDYYLVPAGGYFGTKKACEPIHVQYSYDDNSVAVINGTYEILKGTKVSAKIYDIDAQEKASPEAKHDLGTEAGQGRGRCGAGLVERQLFLTVGGREKDGYGEIRLRRTAWRDTRIGHRRLERRASGALVG